VPGFAVSALLNSTTIPSCEKNKELNRVKLSACGEWHYAWNAKPWITGFQPVVYGVF